MTKTDEELDRDWKPNGRRPQSTIARSFSAELMDIFRIENSVADLDEQVTKKKQAVSSQTSELEALEARIRDMEAKLKRQSVSFSSAADFHASNNNGSSSPRPRPTLNGVFDSIASVAGPHEPRPNAEEQKQALQQTEKYGSRPGTARASQQAVPGALPPTPVGSENGDAERD